MADYMAFWWAKFLVDLQISLLIIAALFLIFIAPLFKRKISQYFCKHERYYENMGCHAICHRCGKDLGFIGHVRAMKKRKEE